MPQYLGLVSLVVRDYDEAIAFYVGTLGFALLEDTTQDAQDKRWVVVAPSNMTPTHTVQTGVLLARATNAQQAARIGDQAGGRVFLFLYTDDIDRDMAAYRSKGVVFVREPQVQAYGTVAVFQDLYGNLWDLIQPDAQPPLALVPPSHLKTPAL